MVRGSGEPQRAKHLRNTVPYRKIMNGEGLVNKVISLGQAHGEKTLFKNGWLAFTGFSWLIKGFNNNINDVKERYCNLKLSSACTATERRVEWSIAYTAQKSYSFKNIIQFKIHNYVSCYVSYPQYTNDFTEKLHSIHSGQIQFKLCIALLFLSRKAYKK